MQYPLYVEHSFVLKLFVAGLLVGFLVCMSTHVYLAMAVSTSSGLFRSALCAKRVRCFFIVAVEFGLLPLRSLYKMYCRIRGICFDALSMFRHSPFCGVVSRRPPASVH